MLALGEPTWRIIAADAVDKKITFVRQAAAVRAKTLVEEINKLNSDNSDFISTIVEKTVDGGFHFEAIAGEIQWRLGHRETLADIALNQVSHLSIELMHSGGVIAHQLLLVIGGAVIGGAPESIA